MENFINRKLQWVWRLLYTVRAALRVWSYGWGDDLKGAEISEGDDEKTEMYAATELNKRDRGKTWSMNRWKAVWIPVIPI